MAFAGEKLYGVGYNLCRWFVPQDTTARTGIKCRIDPFAEKCCQSCTLAIG